VRNVKILELPFYGNLSLRVHRGYKFFNLKRKTVIKSIEAEVNSLDVASEINAVRKASSLGFAPKIRNWNTSDRWYEEEFVSGSLCHLNSGSQTSSTYNIFQRELADCLEEMILLQKPVIVDIQEYTNRLTEIITKRKASTTLIDKTLLSSLDRFLEFTTNSLYSEKIKIPLVFSHGDFSLVNILNTKNGKKVIDWEGANTRNPLYDLYNFFLTELYYKRAAKSLVAEINEATLYLHARLKRKVPEIAATLMEFSTIYRQLYYLERVCLLFERALNENVIKVIFRSINVFNSYEKMTAQNHSF
jgi:thiamine kinase-like enzyme